MNVKLFSAVAAVVGSVVVLGGGCTVGPNYQSPAVRVPGAYGSAPDGKVATTQKYSEIGATTRMSGVPADVVKLASWWESFEDPALNSLIERAVKGNLDVRQAEARLRQARAQLGITSADYYPNVDATGSYTRSRSSKSGSGGGVSGGGSGASGEGGSGSSGGSGFSQRTESNLWRAGLDASWEIDIFGGVRRNVEAARADLDAAGEARNAVLTSLLSELATNYVQVRGAQQRIRIANDNIESQRQTLGLNEARFQAGITSEFDVARARAQVATFEATIPGLRITEAQAIHRIGVLLGESPDSLKAELTPPTRIPMALPEVPVGLPSELLLRRPDIRQAERQLAAATARIGVATADLFPRFSLTGGLGTQASSPGNLFNSRSLFYSIGPSVSWNVFDAGRIRSNIRLQNEKQAELLYAYESTILRSLEEVENSVVSYTRNVERREALSRSVDASRRSVELATGRFAGGQGVGNLLDVLVAQRDLFSAEDALVQSETELSQNLVSMYKALGGGWETFKEQNPQPRDQPTTLPAPETASAR